MTFFLLYFLFFVNETEKNEKIANFYDWQSTLHCIDGNYDFLEGFSWYARFSFIKIVGGQIRGGVGGFLLAWGRFWWKNRNAELWKIIIFTNYKISTEASLKSNYPFKSVYKWNRTIFQPQKYHKSYKNPATIFQDTKKIKKESRNPSP